MKKIIVYVRVSTDEQFEKGYSIESQIEKCKLKAIEFGYSEEDILVIEDHVSGIFAGFFLPIPGISYQMTGPLVQTNPAIAGFPNPVLPGLTSTGAFANFVNILLFSARPDGRLIYWPLSC